MEELDQDQRQLVIETLRLLLSASMALTEHACFAHMKIETEKGPREILLGNGTYIAGGVTLIDWQNAPVAAVFFSSQEGEEYEVEVDGHLVAGRLLRRSLLFFEGRKLVEIGTPQALLTRRGRFHWEAVKDGHVIRLSPRDKQGRPRPASPIQVQLDVQQQQVVELPPRRTTLILGEAGSGKTIVALHRLAFIRARYMAAGRPFRAAVIVPTEGLRRFIEAMLAHLGVRGVGVWIFDYWAGAQARRVFGQIPRRESARMTVGVIRLKRHAGLRAALRLLASRGREEPVPADRRGGSGTTREDLLHLFGDRELLEQAAAAAAGAITAGMVEDVIKHTRVQFSLTTEEEYADVSLDRLQTLDGRAIDDGTPMENAGTIDAEDYPVLFELDRFKAAARGAAPRQPQAYDCLVVDEAQELAPMELALAGRALTPDGTLIVAGDAGQHIDATSYFTDWASAMQALGAGDHEPAVLETGYRCPPEITALARRVRYPDSHAPLPLAAGDTHCVSGPITFLRADNECHLAVLLIETLRDLQSRDQLADVVVICRTPEKAKEMARQLGRGLSVCLALDGNFQFGPGINVTCVQEVKGLEFDYVIVPDASFSAYPNMPESRRALYVAMTRSAHQLVLATNEAWSPILAG